MTGFSPLGIARRDVSRRVLVLLRGDPATIAPLLPEGMRPIAVGGRALVQVAWTQLEAARRRFLPRALAGPTDHLAYRVPAETTDGATGTWVLSRETSSWIGARAGERLSACVVRRARFEDEGDRFGVRLTVHDAEGERLHLAADLDRSSRSSLFASPRDAAEFLARTADVRPIDPFAPEADRIGHEVDRLALEPLTVHEMRSSFLDDTSHFPPHSLELDSAWNVTVTRIAKAPARERAAARPAFDGGGVQPAL